MPSTSRRAFLATSALAVADLNIRHRHSRTAPFSGNIPLQSRHPVSTFFPEMIDAAVLRTLAQTGVDAAQQAGATYADIRVADLRAFEMTQYAILVPYSNIYLEYTYGIRVVVDGAWAFAFGADPTVDGVMRTARSAVNTAKGLATVATGRLSMAPTPLVRDEWSTPVQIDPFTISPDEHAKMLGAYKDTAQRVPYGDVQSASFTWEAETRVFASTEGSLVTQRLRRARPILVLEVWPPTKKQVVLPLGGFAAQSAGFELTLGPELQERIKVTTEEAARLASYPERPLEVGRYAAVWDGVALGSVVGGTLAPALEMDRGLGNDADGMGTSVLAPAEEVLGQPIFSKHLNIRADRALPHHGAVKWDDDGVRTTSFPDIEQGRIVDFFTTRVTAPHLATWYGKSGGSMQCHGSAVSWTPSMIPTGCASHLTVGAGTDRGTIDALLKEISQGIFVCGAATFDSDPQLSGGLLVPQMIYEVKRGQITRRLTGAGVQFSTKLLWKAVTSMGGRETIRDHIHVGYSGDGAIKTMCSIHAPAAQLDHVDVVQVGGRL